VGCQGGILCESLFDTAGGRARLIREFGGISQRLQATNDLGESTEWENKRVDRLPGQAEWGELPISKDPSKDAK